MSRGVRVDHETPPSVASKPVGFKNHYDPIFWAMLVVSGYFLFASFLNQSGLMTAASWVTIAICFLGLQVRAVTRGE